MLSMQTLPDGELRTLPIDSMPVAQATPRLAPSTGLTVRRPAKCLRVLIRRRARAGAARPDWVLEFEPHAEPFVKPLEGWIGARVPLGGTRLEFATKDDAVAFAHRHGWSTETVPPRLASRWRIAGSRAAQKTEDRRQMMGDFRFLSAEVFPQVAGT